MYLGTNCPQVEMLTKTGKKRKALAGNTKDALRVIQSIPSKKAEPFKQWLAQVGKEGLDEIENPELTQGRMKELYETHNGEIKVKIFLKDENIWLTQEKIAELFTVQRPAITKHLKNIFESGELDKNSMSSILEHTGHNGKKYKTRFYNLDAIITTGC